MDVSLLLHIGNYVFLPTGKETHHLFGAGFLLLGAMMTAESLAGQAWHRNLLRTMMMPLALGILSEGLIVVTFLDTASRPIHLILGLSVLLAGWFEARYRLGFTSRARADGFMVPALLLAGFEVGVIHAHGALVSGSFSTHVLMGLPTAGLGVLRLYESRDLFSGVRYGFLGAGVVTLGVELLVDARFH